VEMSAVAPFHLSMAAMYRPFSFGGFDLLLEEDVYAERRDAGMIRHFLRGKMRLRPQHPSGQVGQPFNLGEKVRLARLSREPLAGGAQRQQQKGQSAAQQQTGPKNQSFK